jgi:hypothetical protein
MLPLPMSGAASATPPLLTSRTHYTSAALLAGWQTVCSAGEHCCILQSWSCVIGKFPSPHTGRSVAQLLLSSQVCYLFL